MPRAQLTPVAEEDLFALDEDLYKRALEAICHLELYPREGRPVPLLQLRIDPSLRPELLQYEKRAGLGLRLFIYYELKAEEDVIIVEHIVPVMVL